MYIPTRPRCSLLTSSRPPAQGPPQELGLASRVPDLCRLFLPVHGTGSSTPGKEQTKSPQ